MKKDIRISLIILWTVATSFLGSGYANATLFPVSSSAPTNGVILDNNSLCDITCINTNYNQVRQYIDAPATQARAVDIFFNANTATQEAIVSAYNKSAGTPFNISDAQYKMSPAITAEISGYRINGIITYSGQTYSITNGTMLIANTIGIIDKDLNYRFSNNTRGNLRTTPGVTAAYIDWVVINLNSNTLAPVVNTFTASPTSIMPGQSSTLTWASTGADKCSIDGVDKSASSSMSVSPTSTTTYNIVCSKGTVNSSSKSVTVTVGTIVPPPTAPVVNTFMASPTSIMPGQSSTLTWASTGADKCSIDGVDKSASSSMSVSPTSTTTYNIVCSKGTVNSLSKSVTVTVGTIVPSTNPYAHFLSVPTATKLDTWITTKIVVRSTTLTAANYSKFIDSVITALYKIKSETPSSNKNKRYMINYLIFGLQQIQDGINTEDDFLDGLL